MLIKEIQRSSLNPPVRTQNNTSQTSFANILNDKIGTSEKLQFTKHANMRLNSREINLSDEQMQRVEGGVGKAREKGIRDSLVIVDNIALVVNTKNNMVITAMSNAGANVFTNIDGAVIV